MIQEVDVPQGITLNEYASNVTLAQKVRDLQVEASTVTPRFEGRRVWMINSAEHGGGVAEMLPREVSLFRQLGIETRWVVLHPKADDVGRFFPFTKRLHNLFHGVGDPRISSDEADVYRRVSQELADELAGRIRPGDVVVVHDPQPLALGHYLAEKLDVRLIWRCHIGLDQHTPQTRAAWEFVREFAPRYCHSIFSTPEYIPSFLASNSVISSPAIDPLSHKNRQLSPHKLMGIACDSGLVTSKHPVVTPPFEEQVQRLLPSGLFMSAKQADEIGLFYRPIAAQISRWDRLKGFVPLLEGFRRFKALVERRELPEHFDDELAGRARRRAELTRLVLAGPDPDSVQDDPEARDVLKELVGRYRELPSTVQDDVAVLSLPMRSRKENGLIVNVLQTTATVAVQNSLQEGFGLTATEAMWKRVPVIGTRACGLRHQIRHQCDGWLIDSPEDPDQVAEALFMVTIEAKKAEQMGRSAQRRVWDEYLIFDQITRWLRLFTETLSAEECSRSQAFSSLGTDSLGSR